MILPLFIFAMIRPPLMSPCEALYPYVPPPDCQIALDVLENIGKPRLPRLRDRINERQPSLLFDHLHPLFEGGCLHR